MPLSVICILCLVPSGQWTVDTHQEDSHDFLLTFLSGNQFRTTRHNLQFRKACMHACYQSNSMMGWCIVYLVVKSGKRYASLNFFGVDLGVGLSMG
jgi:hypothetical protein